MMNASTYLVGLYLVYGAVAVGLTAWLARTLFRSGEVFLASVFRDHPGMADAVNRLLVVGFYLLNLGYALLIFRTDSVVGGADAVGILTVKLGRLLLTLGVIHFLNMAVFWKIGRRSIDASLRRSASPARVEVSTPTAF
jgi:hypothetical protein